ncbi:MAG: DNA repair protein RadC [Bacteroidetes bacterium]|nr:DNA repair protein RadC [Bacteroidota bacterium]MBT5530167.1 DNA repair protein RadC [Cytophagia bacterium]MBT3934822.1 DNA repair protein RadC [Bacteroidota bacterium]MBT5991142.1 DNA repair protein RadC [Bacteroidota bacterium]MBT7038810.1 DNA repair protein RadC [Bacteroidota bacterium]
MSSNGNKLGIKSWSEEDRPREKLLLKGPKALTNAELLAILIGSGSKELNALELAKTILNKAENNLKALGGLSVKQLTAFKGIGHAKAISIAAALELGRRRKDELEDSKNKITSSKDVYNFVFPFLADSKQEHFIVLLLNRSNQVIKKVEVSIGGVSGTLVDPKIVFHAALEELSSSIILCHNHPSGNIKPSQADLEITKKISDGAKLFDISVLDHLIFSEEHYFSFADEGLL